MSEKLDGIRAYWNGFKLVSRNGMKINCPDWFLHRLPKGFSVDGELWLGRGTFETLMGIIKLGDVAGWERINFMIFDLPSSKELYETRMSDLSTLELPNYARLVNIRRCRGNDEIHKYLSQIVDLGGEGLMVNKMRSKYYPTRVDSLLKVKVSYIYI